MASDFTTIRRTKIAGFRTFFDGLKKTFPMETLIKSLRLCPCCQAAASISKSSVTSMVTITCSKNGCRMVTGKDYDAAAELWNAPSFRDKSCKRI